MSSIALNAMIQILSNSIFISDQLLPCIRSDNAEQAASLFLHNLPPISFSKSFKMVWKWSFTAFRGSAKRTFQILPMLSRILGFGSYWYLPIKRTSIFLQSACIRTWCSSGFSGIPKIPAALVTQFFDKPCLLIFGEFGRMKMILRLTIICLFQFLNCCGGLTSLPLCYEQNYGPIGYTLENMWIFQI